MKLTINERSIPRRNRTDSEYIETVLNYQKDNLSWMMDFIGSAIKKIDEADSKIESGDFGYSDFGLSIDDPDYFKPENKSVDEILSDLYDYDRTQEMYNSLYEYCKNIEKNITKLENTVINTDV
jgi:hypothetical protein